ncbi:MAG: AraC family transcriptional regulator [Flavobacteriales bacterium]|nr:AraC family transcriptional regulator [Flavobacteriales bacterium]
MTEDGVYHSDIKAYLAAANMSHVQKHADFHIVDLGQFDSSIPTKVISRKLGFFQILTTKHHDAEVNIDGEQYNPQTENIIFLAPEQTVSFNLNKSKKGAVGYMLVFSAEFINFSPTNYGIIQSFPYFNMNCPPVYFLAPDKNNFFIDQMKKILECFQNFDPDNLEIIRSYLTILLFEAKRMFVDGSVTSLPKSRNEEITYQFETLITKTKSKKQKLEYYANKLNYSVIYLAECVKKATGKTAKQILSEHIIWESKSFLTQSTKTIDDIAYQLGYNDTSNFITFFKKNTGSTPSQFRK